MMLPLLLSVAVSTPQVAPGNLISGMFRKYNSAKAVTGTIELVQASENKTVSTFTQLQIDRTKRRLYVRQTRTQGNNPGEWLVVADGNTIAYSPWEGAVIRQGQKFIYELMRQEGPNEGVLLTERDAYTAARKSLGDVDLPLNVLISRRSDLQFTRGQLATFQYLRDEKVGEKTVRVIGGDWRDYGDAPISANYELWIDDEFNLHRFARQESVSPPPPTPTSPKLPLVKITNVWKINVTTDGALDEKLFQVPR